MKNVSTSLKSVFATLAVAVLVALSATPSFANNEKKSNKSNRVPVEVKYVGSDKESPVLEVSLDNVTGEAITVQLREMDGTVLYSVTSSEKKITRKFRIDNFSVEPVKLKVVVAGKGKPQIDTFEINRQRVEVENIVIAKL
ncbi:MAG TPA: hypothetical protein VIK80_04615 [Flavihumibacter sp.]|jgi:hypothetical protein